MTSLAPHAWCLCPSCETTLVFAPGPTPPRVECHRCRYRFIARESKPFGPSDWERTIYPEAILGCLRASDLVLSARKLRLGFCAVGRGVLEQKWKEWLLQAVMASET